MPTAVGGSRADWERFAVLRVDLDWRRWPTREVLIAAWSLPEIQGDEPAYVFFTSGSTGQPKAILGCHKGLSHFLRLAARYLRDWHRVIAFPS